MVVNQTSSVVSDFVLNNHENIPHRLSMMMGDKGILVGFTGDVWDLSCVRYVLWMQRQSFKLAAQGVTSAFVIPNETYELNGFFMSIPRNIPFPLLADPKQSISAKFGMETPGFMLLNRDGEVQERWYVTDTSSLSIRVVLNRIG